MMERVKRLWKTQRSVEAEYEPIRNDGIDTFGPSDDEGEPRAHFSWMTYSIFLLLGVAMLWAWYAESPLET